MFNCKCVLREIIIVLSLSVLVSISSCHNFTHKPHTAASPKYQAQLRLQPGDKYYYSISTETKSTFSVNDNDMENNSSVKAGLLYEVLKDTAGGYQIKMTYSHFDITSKGRDGEKNINSDNGANSADPVEKILALVKNSSVFMLVDKQGHVINVTGYPELVDKLMSSIPPQDAASTQKTKDVLTKMLGNSFIKTSFEQGFSLLPDSAIYEGDTWTKQLSEFSDIKLNTSVQYTLTSIENNQATINAKADIEDVSDISQLVGTNVNVNLSGKMNCDYTCDMASGIMLTGNIQTSMKGNIEVRAKDVPVEIKIKKAITVKKV